MAARRFGGMISPQVLAHLPQVNGLVDISGRSRFIGGLVGGADDPTLIGKLQAFANANLATEDRRPVARAIGKIQWRVANNPRIRQETSAWLKAHAAG